MLDHVERFGLQRTRLVAVAEDLGMSHANIYRFFKNKNAIIDSIALSRLAEAEEMATVAIDENEPAKQRLIELLTGLNAHLHRKLEHEPAAVPTFTHVLSDRSEELASHLEHVALNRPHSLLL